MSILGKYIHIYVDVGRQKSDKAKCTFLYRPSFIEISVSLP